MKAGDENSQGFVKFGKSLDPRKELVTLLNLSSQENGAVIGYHCFYPVPRLPEHPGQGQVYTRTIPEATAVMLRTYQLERERMGLK